MEPKNIFLNISPLDHRYCLSNQNEYKKLSKYLSEEANIRYCLKVEIVYLKTIIKHLKVKPNKHDNAISQLDKLVDNISPQEICREEVKTHHDLRALVNVLKRHVPGNIRNLVHLGTTSYDIRDTATALRIKHCIRRVVLPLLIDLENALIDLTIKHAETLQVGRTHGQHAVPITFGYAVAEYISRLGKSINRLEQKSKNLAGKLAGAVGAYNSLSMITRDVEKLEQEFLENLGLLPSEHSTQIVEPEYLLELLLEINTAFGIIANLADDFRNLQRSEIDEIREEFTKDQVGSSTMPQKRNPWNCEHVKSLWKAFYPRIITMFMDQISEHQRDLTNSASSRFTMEYITGFVLAVKRMKNIITGLYVDKQRMQQNIDLTGDLVLAEAAYILLSLGGEVEAHELIRKATLICARENNRLLTVLKQNDHTWQIIAAKLKEVVDKDPEEFFSNPQYYQGIASSKAKKIAKKYQKVLKRIEEVLVWK